jgi:DNA-binding GntR family transcriptional regulator
MDPERAGWQLDADTDQYTRQAAGRGPADGVTWPDQGRRPPTVSARRPASEPKDARPAVSVLADRLAAALVHHEPGWRLPRHSALARRYNVSAAEIDAAIDELIARHLIRRLADGQLYRASPAEYLINLEGVSGLASYADAMGADFSCRSRQVAWRLPPEDIGWALKVPPGQHVCVVRFFWTVGGEPAALCTSYLPGDLARQEQVELSAGLPNVLNIMQLDGLSEAAVSTAVPTAVPTAAPTEVGTAGPAGASDPLNRRVSAIPGALHIELQAPPPAVARSLRLTAGQQAMIVTVRFDDKQSGRPVGLTLAVLRPDMFRVVVQSEQPPLPDRHDGNSPGSGTHTVEDWEP